MIGLEQILDSGLKVSVVGKRLSVQGPANLVAQYRPALEKFGRDLVDLKTSELIDGVGSCPGCQLNLIGLRTFDGYINRFCPVCGGWQTCTRETGPTGITPGRIPLNATNVTASTAPKNQTSLFT